MERRIEHALLKRERILSDMADPVGDAVAMHRSPTQRLQDKDIERALENGQSIVVHCSPCIARVRLRPIGMQGEIRARRGRTRTLRSGWGRCAVGGSLS